MKIKTRLVNQYLDIELERLKAKDHDLIRCLDSNFKPMILDRTINEFVKSSHFYSI